MNKITKYFIIINIIWLIVISMFFVPKETTIFLGKKYLVKVAPVDPRDLFRGDYYTLSLQNFSNLDMKTIPHNFSEKDILYDKNIFVYLDTSNKYIKPGYLTLQKDHYKKDKASNIFITGKIQYVYKNTIYVKYGIENFYIPEGTGNELNNNISLDKLAMKIAIDNDGNTFSQALLANGKEIDFRK